MKVAPTSERPAVGAAFMAVRTPAEPNEVGPAGRRRRNGTSERSRLRGREGCAVCADEKEG